MSLYQNFKPHMMCLLNGEGKLAVAVSGGSDSMALTLLLGEYAKEKGIELVAITVDHGLRSEAALEAKQVGKWLGAYGIEHHILRWEGEKKSSNIQANARKARYSLMVDFCKSREIKLLAVAHTAEDQAETILMRLMRGSGVDGLSGISQLNEIFGMFIIRPLLDFTRLQLQQYLQEKQQQWVNDPSNENKKYKRVVLRKFISLSDEPELMVRRIADTAKHMQRAQDYISLRVQEKLFSVFTFHPAGFYVLNTAKLKLLHAEEALRGLKNALQHVSGNEYPPRFENLQLLYENILNNNIGSGCTLWGCEIARSKKKNSENYLYIYRETAQISGDIDIAGGENRIWDGRFIFKIKDANLNIENLKIGALGKAGYALINRQDKDFFKNINLPKKVIYALPAIRALEKLIYVPHIGYCVDDFLKIKFDIQNVRMREYK